MAQFFAIGAPYGVGIKNAVKQYGRHTIPDTIPAQTDIFFAYIYNH